MNKNKCTSFLNGTTCSRPNYIQVPETVRCLTCKKEWEVTESRKKE